MVEFEDPRFLGEEGEKKSNNAEYVKLAALWEDKDKKGEPMLTGPLGNEAQLLVRKNSMKRNGKNDPDYYLWVRKNNRRGR